MQKPAGAPTCFGTNLWSAVAVECIGGPDPAYTHPKTMAHVRDKCGWYSACANACAASKSQAQLMQIRPNVQAPPRPAPMLTRPAHFVPQPQYPTLSPTQPQAHPQVVPTYATQLVPPHVAQQGPVLVPMVYQQPGHQMPSYLTVPEPVNLNESWVSRLAREILRSMFKSAGHTTSSFFDHNPMRAHQPPNQAVQVQVIEEQPK